MINKTMSHPVVLFLFKRPVASQNLLNKIVRENIKKIYIFIDGPKKISDSNLINQTIKIVKKFKKHHKNINFIISISKKNLGLQQSITRGLNKVFKTESAAIILEDDCLPSSDFFNFINQILNKYKNNHQVMSVTGSGVGKTSRFSYDFSRYQQCWGFGTWKRAWKLYDPSLSQLKPLTWKDIYMRHYFNTMLHLTKVGQVKSWAFKWSYAHFINHSLAIIPSGNLIKNIGFDKAATNTKTNSPLSSIKITKLSFPLSHPKKIQENIKLSKKIEKMYYKNIIAFLGMTRQVFFYYLKKYAHRN